MQAMPIELGMENSYFGGTVRPHASDHIFFMLLAVWRLEKHRRAPPSAGRSLGKTTFIRAVRSSKSFCMFCMKSAQILATSSSSAVPELPKLVLSIYGYVQFFNGDTSSVLHLECIEGSQFEDSWAILSCILVIAVTQLAMFQLTGYSIRHFGRKIIYPKIQSIIFTLLNCLYPLVT